MFAGKPVIGITGGIGSGKSFIAKIFGQQGGLVLSADDQVRALYRDPKIKETLKSWWGQKVINSQNEVDKRAVARIIFDEPAEKRRLEGLLHPRVISMRQAAMAAAAKNAQVLAFIWDIPLLFEVGSAKECDAIVYVDAPREARLARVQATRGWDDAELARRENLQLPLDFKRRMSKYIVQNTADVGFARNQVREVLSAILTNSAMRARLEDTD
jgi:dephospho-CoA kinase